MMGWLPQSEFDRLKREALALTKEERESLNFEQARRFVAFDTIEMARWSGLLKSGRLPWECVARLKGLQSLDEGLPKESKP
jgi:hypothetical protein